jgi:dTDP-4-dehydrorhamnose 3,5-epimerase
MKFTPTTIPGVMLIEYEPFRDKRGAFMRSFCATEFAEHGLASHVEQSNLSVNPVRGTLRGFHAQRADYAEAKTLSVWEGGIVDVVIDLRPDSPTFKQHLKLDWTGHAIHVPAGVANAFLTTEPNTVVSYFVSRPYTPEAEFGIRWNDPTFGVEWPFEPVLMSEKDRSHPDWTP